MLLGQRMDAAHFRTRIARLLGQRLALGYDLGRRGAAASNRAIAVNTPIKAPSLTVTSLIGILELCKTLNYYLESKTRFLIQHVKPEP
jgi:hypothetical protein